MAKGRKDWVVVNLDGLGKVLVRRGKYWVINELVQNAMDEDVTRIDVTLTRPANGQSILSVIDDSPEGFRDLSDVYTMFGESYKKSDTKKRGFINVGDKYVLALCTEAVITTTTGEVSFNGNGRTRTDKRNRMVGSEFKGHMKLTIAEYEEMCGAVRKIISTVPIFFNGEKLPERNPLREWEATLETVISDAEGNMRRTERKATVSVYRVLDGEKAHVYEMGIPVVELNAKYHVNVGQKVPVNVDRDNVKPAYLKAIYVELLNHTQDLITKDDAKTDWVRTAAGDSRCTAEAFTQVMDLRFGPKRVSYDMNDVGSNREAASQNWTVVTGGAMSGGEWENARRVDAIRPAGAVFPTDLAGSKTPAKRYQRNEWTPQMQAYGEFIMAMAPKLINKQVSVDFICDSQIGVRGCYHPTFGTVTVNLAWHEVDNWQENVELMIHEFTHEKVQSNDHLNHEFYGETCRIGASLALLAAERPEMFKCMYACIHV